MPVNTNHVLFGLDPLWTATALLIATYAAIMSERLNRAIVALLGAGLMISLGLSATKIKFAHISVSSPRRLIVQPCLSQLLLLGSQGLTLVCH